MKVEIENGNIFQLGAIYGSDLTILLTERKVEKLNMFSALIFSHKKGKKLNFKTQFQMSVRRMKSSSFNEENRMCSLCQMS